MPLRGGLTLKVAGHYYPRYQKTLDSSNLLNGFRRMRKVRLQVLNKKLSQPGTHVALIILFSSVQAQAVAPAVLAQDKVSGKLYWYALVRSDHEKHLAAGRQKVVRFSSGVFRNRASGVLSPKTTKNGFTNRKIVTQVLGDSRCVVKAAAYIQKLDTLYERAVQV